MADTTKNTQETGTQNVSSTTSPTLGNSTTSRPADKHSGQSGSATAARTAREQSPGKDYETGHSSFKENWERGTQKGAEMVDQARENFSEIYDRASRGVTETFDNAVDYSRKNPGTATLIAFGAGIGIGLLLANNAQSRSRTQRIVPPVMNALSEIAAELFR